MSQVGQADQYIIGVRQRVSFAAPRVAQQYHWGQKDYLPNLYSRRIVWVIPCVLCAQKELWRELPSESK